ncbi:unnamed protein product [Allacma fusca]|uniref:Uncharacterized protein n=1 Tax=Allacma fusca TaxID=39272 RepID=A0A8J2LWJ2_9HEXA|nr:unnamed protein product [Allacma fusca]
MEAETTEGKQKEPSEKTVSKFELRAEDKTLESAKENFLTFMESVWPTVANYYFEVEKEILTSIKKGNPNKIKFLEKEENQLAQKKSSLYILNKEKNQFELKPQLSLTDENASSCSIVSTYDCTKSLKKLQVSETQKQKKAKSRKKIVETKDPDGNVVWDVIEAISCPTFPSPPDGNRVENSAPIAVHHDPGLLYTDSPDNIPPDIRQAIVDSEAQIRQALSTCFGKISKAFTNSYPKIRLMINKAYPQIRHTVSCSYPNIQYTINNSYDKVQGTVRSAYPRIRKTVTGSYPKRQTVSACYRKVRQSQIKIQHNNKSDSTLSSNKLSDANFDLMSRLTAANAEISQALHNTSKKVSIALGTANLEILQALKNSSNKVSKSLIKANSEILEALALANDDLRKNLAMICNEAARALDIIKVQLSKFILDLHPKVWQVILKTYENLQQALEHSHVEILETLAVVSSEVCEQISTAHGKYSEVKVTVNYELSLALAKANSQVLQVLIAANSKVSDVLDRNMEKVNQITTSSKLGSNLELLESRVWKVIEKGEADVWKTSENASFTIESAVESTDSRLWKVADDADNNLRKAVQGVEHKLVASIGSSEWKLKSCAERLEALVTECVGMFASTSWQSVSCYIGEFGWGKFSETQLRNNIHSKSEVNIPKAHSSSSVKVLLGCNNNGYYVGFPESEDDEDFDPRALLSLKASEFPLETDSRDEVSSQDVNVVPAISPEQGDGVAVEGKNLIKTKETNILQAKISSNGATVAVANCSEALDLAAKVLQFSDNSMNSAQESLEKVPSSSKPVLVSKTEQEIQTCESGETLFSGQLGQVSVELLSIFSELLPVHEINEYEAMALPGDKISKFFTQISEHETASVSDIPENKSDTSSERETVSDEDHIVKAEPKPHQELRILEKTNMSDPLVKVVEVKKQGAAGEAASNTLTEVFSHSQTPSFEQLSASFRANLEKLQLSLSTNASSSTASVCPSTVEAEQLLRDCQTAWNMISTLYRSNTHVPAKKFDQISVNKTADNVTTTTLRSEMRENICFDCIKANKNFLQEISSKPNWHGDIIFCNIPWEAVDFSEENLFADLDEEESIEFELPIRNSSESLYDTPKSESLEIINEISTPDDSLPEPSEIMPDLPDDPNIYPIVPVAPSSNATLTKSASPSDSLARIYNLESQETPTVVPEKDVLNKILIRPTTFENSDFEEASSSSASPPASVITLPFTDDEQLVDICPQTSFEDGSFVSESPSYQSENIKEMISSFVELSSILFYQASRHSHEDPERFSEFPPHLPLPFMSAEMRPLPSPVSHISPPGIIPSSPLSPPLNSPMEIQTSPGKTISSQTNIRRGENPKKYYYPSKSLNQRICPALRDIIPRSKLTHFKSRLKHFLPCFQNSYNSNNFRVHPIKRNCSSSFINNYQSRQARILLKKKVVFISVRPVYTSLLVVDDAPYFGELFSR